VAGADPNPELPGLLGHLRRALGHALEALRCYFALFGAEAEQRLGRVVRRALWPLALMALGIIGAVFVASGTAQLLDTWAWPRWPGCGRIVVGGGILAIFLILLLVERRKGRT